MSFIDCDDPNIHPRVPSASSALLSAALGGLLCLTPACHGTPNGTPDTGTNVDGATDADAASDSARDTSATDAPVATDAQPDATSDAAIGDAGTDAAVDLDAASDATVADVTALDASNDTTTLDAATLDVTIAVDVIPPCDVAADRVITYSDAATDVTLESFTAQCTTAGGHVEIAPHCGGFNSCAGFSYDETRGTWTEHNCAGLNTCTGYSCVIP